MKMNSHILFLFEQGTASQTLYTVCKTSSYFSEGAMFRAGGLSERRWADFEKGKADFIVLLVMIEYRRQNHRPVHWKCIDHTRVFPH